MARNDGGGFDIPYLRRAMVERLLAETGGAVWGKELEGYASITKSLHVDSATR
jgi:hypothetical protein